MRPEVEAIGARIFAWMVACYGAAAVERFATGQRDADGQDLGVLTARRMWSAALADVPSEVTQEAIRRAVDAYPRFAPTLGEFRDLVRAAMRARPAPPQGDAPRIGCDPEVAERIREQVRDSLARQKIDTVIRKLPEFSPRVPEGVAGLLALCAHAAGLAGSDEAQMLRGLEARVTS